MVLANVFSKFLHCELVGLPGNCVSLQFGSSQKAAAVWGLAGADFWLFNFLLYEWLWRQPRRQPASFFPTTTESVIFHSAIGRAPLTIRRYRLCCTTFLSVKARICIWFAQSQLQCCFSSLISMWWRWKSRFLTLYSDDGIPTTKEVWKNIYSRQS